MAEGIAAVLKEKRDPVTLDQMTLLDLFAAFASIGAMSLGDPDQTAKQAYAAANAMLDERKKQ